MDEILSLINSASFAVSTLIAIPLAIIANIITPKVQKFIDNLLTKSRNKRTTNNMQSLLKQIEELKSQKAKIDEAKSNILLLMVNNFTAIFRMGIYICFFVIVESYTNIPITIASISGSGLIFNEAFDLILSVFSSVMLISVALIIFMECARSFRVNKNVIQYDEFTNKIGAKIKDIENKISKLENQ